FLAGFVVCEGVLVAATVVLPSGEGAFSAAVFADILLINSLAAIGLICSRILQRDRGKPQRMAQN
ncbi:hypothetical protein ACC731_38160, partial [Rhizobium ruizarguesonis]